MEVGVLCAVVRCMQTALVEGLAQRIAAGDVPEPLQGVTLVALDMGLLMAGEGAEAGGGRVHALPTGTTP